MSEKPPKKRLYGFARTSTHSKKRSTYKQKEKRKIYKANRSFRDEFRKKRRYYNLYLDQFRGNNYTSYLSPSIVNDLYHKHDKDIMSTISYIITRYRDFDKLFVDWEDGVRDIIFCKIMKMTDADWDPDLEHLLREFHEDLLLEAIYRFYKQVDQYVHTDRSSFYTYIVNALPYAYYLSYLSCLTREKEHSAIKDRMAYWTSYDLEQEEIQINFDLIYKFKPIRQ